MSLAWHEYDSFDWAHAQQSPMASEQRLEIEMMAAGILQLSQEDRTKVWGVASPPGRFAATVLHIASGVSHSYQAQAMMCGIADIGVKIFKTTTDARREAQRVLPFHRTLVHRLPGLPTDHVQKTLGGGRQRDGQGAERDFVVQEWVRGETLEVLVRRTWPGEPIDGADVQSILAQLFAGIIIPLWSEGTVWWDVRDANYCWDAYSQRLILIDIDALSAYIDEILQTPTVWTRRDKGRVTALTRLRGLVLRLLLAQGFKTKKQVETMLGEAWQAELEPALNALGRDPARKSERKAAALAALQQFCEQLDRAALLRKKSSQQAFF